jgi:hypothetical protein
MKWDARVRSLKSKLNNFYMIKSQGCNDPEFYKKCLFCMFSWSFEVWFGFLGWWLKKDNYFQITETGYTNNQWCKEMYVM